MIYYQIEGLGYSVKDKKQAEAELGQAQLNWDLGFVEAGA